MFTVEILTSKGVWEEVLDTDSFDEAVEYFKTDVRIYSDEKVRITYNG